MARVQEFMHGGRLCRRWEIEGEPPVEVVETQETTPYRGVEYPTEVVAWNGLHKVFDGRNEWLSDRSLVFDAGPKLGVTLTFTQHPDRPATEEEKAEVRRHLDLVIRQLFPGLCLADGA